MNTAAQPKNYLQLITIALTGIIVMSLELVHFNPSTFEASLLTLGGICLASIAVPNIGDKKHRYLDHFQATLTLGCAGVYYLVKGSPGTESTYTAVLLSSLSLGILWNLIANRLEEERKANLFLHGILGIFSFQVGLTSILSNQTFTTPPLQWICGFSILNLVLCTAYHIHKGGRSSAFTSTENRFLLLSATPIFLAYNTLLNPESIYSVNAAIALSFLISLAGKCQHFKGMTRVLEREISESFDHSTKLMRSIINHARKKLESIELEVGKLRNEGTSLTEVINSVRSHSNSIPRYIEGQIWKNYLTKNKVSKSTYSLAELIDEIKDSFNHHSHTRKLSFDRPDSIEKISTNKSVLMLTILDIINNDNFIDYDFSIHVYRTVNSGEKHINIDIRGQKSSLESTNKRESSFDIKQAKTLASELGGGLVIKDHSKGNLHITLYFPDYQFYINPNEDASTIPVSLTPNSVLIVDDDPAIVDLLADFCESYGIRSIKAENGQQALEVFEAQQPSCVITDILMPQVSGIEVLKKMSGKGSRLIGLSGASSPNIRNEAMSAGADSFYSKPPNLAKMITEVKAATKGKKD